MEKISVKKLINLLSSFDNSSIYKHDWNSVRDLVINGIPKSKLINFEWLGMNTYKNNDTNNYYPIKLDEISFWSTYDNSNCISLEYYIKNNKLLCDALICDGNLFDGSYKNKRFKCTIQLPNKFIKQFESSIINKLNNVANDAYNSFLEAQRIQFKNKFIRDYLKLV
jgi:hypothetical protein